MSRSVSCWSPVPGVAAGALIAHALGVIGVAACTPDHVHVYVESSTFRDVDVEIAVFGASGRVDHEYAASFVDPVDGEAGQRYTDFNLVLDDVDGPLDLRVAVPSSSRWSGDRRIVPPGDGRDLHVLLYQGESELDDIAIANGDPAALTLYSTGLAAAWRKPDGVYFTIEPVPDRPLGRGARLIEDAGASGVRVTSPTTTSTFGPERLAVTWRAGDGGGRLVVRTLGVEPPPDPVVELRPADEIAAACPLDATAAAVITLSRDGAALVLGRHDELGQPTGEAAVTLGTPVRSIGGVVAPVAGVIAAVETDAGWRLVRIDLAGAVTASRDTDELLALALTPDRGLVVTAQLQGDDLVIQTYFAASLEPSRAAAVVVAADRLPIGIYREVGLSSCAVAWPELRADGSGAIDVRVLDLDGTGQPREGSRVLNASWDGLHVAPAIGCMSPLRSYATFASAAGEGSITGTLVLRKVPPAPPPEESP